MHKALFLNYLNIFLYLKRIMLNKNCADYTNFDGKTNKKIVQAPGGASSFSLAWNNDKTDYGPERAIKKKNNYNEEGYNNPVDYQNKGSFNYNEPIKVMEDRPMYQMKSQQLGYPPRPETYGTSVQSNSIQGNRKYGGENGYNNYAPQENHYQNTKPKQDYYQQDSLDTKLQEHGKTKNSFSKPPQNPQSNQRTCIKIHEQKSNVMIGDNNYNYWKQPNEGRKYSNQSNRRPNVNEPPRSQEKQQPVYQEKTSVKVHNPPGGKSNFTFG